MALEETFDSPEQAAAALKALREAPPEEEIPEQAEELVEEEPELELELEEEFEEDQLSPAIDAPVGYQDVWQDLEPEVQEVIAKQAQEANSLVTRSTEELANLRKELEEKSQGFTEERARTAEALERLSGIPDEPDPDLMDPRSEKYDPDKFNELQADRKRALRKAEEAQGELDKINSQREEEEQAALAESQKLRNEYLAQEWPEVLDPVKGPALQEGILKHAQTLGLNLEIIPYLTGPMLHAIEESRLYREAKSKSVKKRAPRAVRPSAPSSPARRRTKKLDQLKQKALESGSEKDFLAVMKANRAAQR